jgi:hypothetical protein
MQTSIIRHLASIIGTLSAARLQFPLASLYLDKLQRLKKRAINSARNNLGWDGLVWLEPSIIGELKHWLNQFRKRVFYRLIKPISPQTMITTDASPSGWGARLIDAKTSKVLSQFFGSWTPQMSAASSNKRELVAVRKAIETFLPTLETISGHL